MGGAKKREGDEKTFHGYILFIIDNAKLYLII